MTTTITQEQGFNGFSPKIPRVITTSTLTQVTTAGWWNNNPINGETALNPQDLVCICYAYGTSSQATALFAVSISSGIVTLSLADADIVTPTTAGNVAIYNNTSGQLTQNIAALNNVANTSATPGTVRSIYGEITSTATTQTSGNLVGVRGSVTFVGSSTSAYIYGTQGKLIASGTLASGQFQAGVFGQLDIHAATINGGQLAPIWGDYGTTSGTLSDQTGLYGIAMTNTTAAVLQGQIYLYGGAQNLMYLNTNAGLSGVTYFKNAGTGSGSWGNGTPPTPTKVLKISVDGTAYYLPLVAQNT